MDFIQIGQKERGNAIHTLGNQQQQALKKTNSCRQRFDKKR